MATKLTNQLATLKSDERARAFATYQILVRRADAPKPGDVPLLRAALIALGLNAADFESDAEALVEYADLEEFLVPVSKLKKQREAFEAWRAAEQAKVDAIDAERMALENKLVAMQSANLAGPALKAAGEEAQTIFPKIQALEIQARAMRATFAAETARRLGEVESTERPSINAANRRRDLERAHPYVLRSETAASGNAGSSARPRDNGPIFNPGVHTAAAMDAPPAATGPVTTAGQFG